jgi:hypothetical protein
MTTTAPGEAAASFSALRRALQLDTAGANGSGVGGGSDRRDSCGSTVAEEVAGEAQRLSTQTAEAEMRRKRQRPRYCRDGVGRERIDGARGATNNGGPTVGCCSQVPPLRCVPFRPFECISSERSSIYLATDGSLTQAALAEVLGRDPAHGSQPEVRLPPFEARGREYRI